MTRQMNMNEAQMQQRIEELNKKLERIEVAWNKLQEIMEKVADGHISGNDVVELMEPYNKLREGDEQ